MLTIFYIAHTKWKHFKNERSECVQDKNFKGKKGKFWLNFDRKDGTFWCQSTKTFFYFFFILQKRRKLKLNEHKFNFSNK